MMRKYIFLIIVFGVLLVSCKEEALPKPKAMLRLEYPDSTAVDFAASKYSFSYNAIGRVKKTNESAVTIEYPKMNGAIFLSYKPVEGNLSQLLSDAQKLSYEHAAKADNILEQPFVNPDAKVYGMFYDVKGDAASQSQFYVTDSTEHFLTGSLYFSVKPNYDSILPAAVYLQEDIRKIMETLRWIN
ncbi:gliding motility lipoprotein GldD [Cellulophaga omnivescoria]|uniref:gliding motility lipoprotein GldD n=1 Tax=Cellulophaga omnivescoria TaxID=1888890 RepID=UPI0022F07F96|nr:gliding motility lipoprotein GldD [Cellulophaga omnivescoria]WBU90378.1 gliding motility lipoprotein GldD [Cellulophaga omnivescoria]